LRSARADVDVLIVGAGHGGLGVAARLMARGRTPVIVDANARVGDTWRARWASLRLFTPRFVNGLPGVRFPDGADPFPGKDEVADYQERYAREIGLEVRLDARVTGIRRVGDAFAATIGGETIQARSVIIANGAHQTPRIPSFAAAIGPEILQRHSSEYGRAGALPAGPVLVVGGRNSGAEIAMELSRTHEVTLTLDTRTSYGPARWRSTRWWRAAQFRSWVLRGAILPGPIPWPLKPPSGRWVEVDVRRAEREGVLRLVPRAVGAEGPVLHLADGSSMRPTTVIWATGFRIDDSWIDLPSGERGISIGRHGRGAVPGLWTVRAGLLATLHFRAMAVANDIVAAR
jgi:putative flavoprotein involved in K+ transport